MKIRSACLKNSWLLKEKCTKNYARIKKSCLPELLNSIEERYDVMLKEQENKLYINYDPIHIAM